MDVFLKQLEERNKELQEKIIDLEDEIYHNSIEDMLMSPPNVPWYAPAGLNRGRVIEGKLWNEF